MTLRQGRLGRLGSIMLLPTVFVLYGALGWSLDATANRLRLSLWESGWDQPAAYFYCSVLVFVFPFALYTLALTYFASRATGLSDADIGLVAPRRPLLSLMVALLSVPVTHYIIFGILPQASSIIMFQRLPWVFAKLHLAASDFANPQSVNRLLFSWSIWSVTEEVFYRGLIDASLIRRFGRTAGILLGATVFAAGHIRVRGG